MINNLFDNVLSLMPVKLFYIFTSCFPSCGHATPFVAVKIASDRALRHGMVEYCLDKPRQNYIISLAYLFMADTNLACLSELLFLALSFV